MIQKKKCNCGHTNIHMYTYRRGKRKVILGPAGRTLRAQPAGKTFYTTTELLPNPTDEQTIAQ